MLLNWAQAEELQQARCHRSRPPQGKTTSRPGPPHQRPKPPGGKTADPPGTSEWERTTGLLTRDRSAADQKQGLSSRQPGLAAATLPMLDGPWPENQLHIQRLKSWTQRVRGIHQPLKVGRTDHEPAARLDGPAPDNMEHGPKSGRPALPAAPIPDWGGSKMEVRRGPGLLTYGDSRSQQAADGCA